jgi:hypothetical protein
MLNHLTTINGVIYNTEREILIKAFNAILQTTLQPKVRLIGYDIYYKDLKTKAFITSPDADEKTYFIDIRIEDDENELQNFIKSMKKTLIKYDLTYDIGIFVESKDKAFINTEEYFIHPDFKNRYNIT